MLLLYIKPFYPLSPLTVSNYSKESFGTAFYWQLESGSEHQSDTLLSFSPPSFPFKANHNFILHHLFYDMNNFLLGFPMPCFASSDANKLAKLLSSSSVRYNCVLLVLKSYLSRWLEAHQTPWQLDFQFSWLHSFHGTNHQGFIPLLMLLRWMVTTFSVVVRRPTRWLIRIANSQPRLPGLPPLSSSITSGSKSVGIIACFN